jgi:hypothetical protein
VPTLGNSQHGPTFLTPPSSALAIPPGLSPSLYLNSAQMTTYFGMGYTLGGEGKLSNVTIRRDNAFVTTPSPAFLGKLVKKCSWRGVDFNLALQVKQTAGSFYPVTLAGDSSTDVVFRETLRWVADGSRQKGTCVYTGILFKFISRPSQSIGLPTSQPGNTSIDRVVSYCVCSRK